MENKVKLGSTKDKDTQYLPGTKFLHITKHILR